MANTIFINYRREDSIGTAGRLHDRLAQTFGQKNLFMDVDSIPAGVDFVADLNRQVAACDLVLVVIGPNWLDAKDESGGRRLDNPDDFVVIEIAAALARNIRVIPVLVDGARMPRADKLPDSIKSLVRRNAVEVRNAYFGRDAETLVAKMREALGDKALVARGREPLGDKAAGPGRWRVRTVVGVAAVAVLLLIGVGGYAVVQFGPATLQIGFKQREADDQERRARAAAEAEARRKAEEAEQQRLAAAKVEQERQASAAAEAEAKRKAEEAEQQRVPAINKALRAAVRYSALIEQGRKEFSARNYDSAVASYSEAIRLDPKNSIPFFYRGLSYMSNGDHDRAIADYTEAIRLDPKNAFALVDRGLAYEKKGDYNQAIADYTEAIRLDPNYADAFCNRGYAKLRINDKRGGGVDIAKAKGLANSSISGNRLTQCR